MFYSSVSESSHDECLQRKKNKKHASINDTSIVPHLALCELREFLGYSCYSSSSEFSRDHEIMMVPKRKYIETK